MNFTELYDVVFWLIRLRISGLLNNQTRSTNSMGNFTNLENVYICFNVSDISSVNKEVPMMNQTFQMNIKFRIKSQKDESFCVYVPNKTLTTMLPNQIQSTTDPHTRTLTIRQMIMICSCSLILGGVALSAFILRLRYYCKRRKSNGKDDACGYNCPSRASFGELGIQNDRRLKVTRQVNYPLFDIYPNNMFQKVQNLESPVSVSPQLIIHHEQANSFHDYPQLQVATKVSPVITRNSTAELYPHLRAGSLAINSRKSPQHHQHRRHSVTNKIDSVMHKHYQKVGKSRPPSSSILGVNRSPKTGTGSVEIIRLLARNKTSPNKTRKIKNAQSCSERLDFFIR